MGKDIIMDYNLVPHFLLTLLFLFHPQYKVLTGDKQETAINISRRCRLIQDFHEVIILDGLSKEEIEQQVGNSLTR